MISLEEKYQNLVKESLKANNYLLRLDDVICRGEVTQCNEQLTEEELLKLIRHRLIVLFPDKTLRPVHTEYIYKNSRFAPAPNRIISVESSILIKEQCRPSFQDVNKDKFKELFEKFFGDKILAEIFTEAFFSLHFNPKGISNYQFSYLRDLLSDKANIALISSPTGSGKTEIYMLYTVAKILKDKLSNNTQGVKFIIIYPRKALERDQLERFLEFLYNLNQRLSNNNLGNLKIAIGILDGDSTYEKNIKNGTSFRQIQCGVCKATNSSSSELKYHNGKIVCDRGHEYDFTTDIREKIANYSYDILISNFSMLNRILPDCKYRTIISSSLRGIIIDEAHTIKDVEGAYNVLTILRILLRYLIVKNNGKIDNIDLKQLKNMKIILSSATISTANSEVEREKEMEKYIEYILGNLYNELGRKFIYYDFDKLNSSNNICNYGKRLLVLQSLLVHPQRGIETLAQTILVNTLLFSYFINKSFVIFADSKEEVERLYRFVNTNIKKRKEIFDHFCVKKKKMLKLWERYCEQVRGYDLNILLKDDILGYSYLYACYLSHLIKKQKVTNLSELLEFIENNQNKIKILLIKRMNKRIKKINKKIEKSYDYEHADLSKEERTNKENKLKNGSLRGLISTSTLELGIDIGDLSVILQYKPPKKSESFIQRIGRGGRSDKSMFISIGVLLLGNLDYIYAIRDHAERLLFNVHPIPLPLSNQKFLENIVYKSLFDLLGYNCIMSKLYIACNDDSVISTSHNIINFINSNKDSLLFFIEKIYKLIYDKNVYNIDIKFDEIINQVINKLQDTLDKLVRAISNGAIAETDNPIKNIVREINNIDETITSVYMDSDKLTGLYSNFVNMWQIRKRLEELQFNFIELHEMRGLIDKLSEKINAIRKEFENPEIEEILRNKIDLDNIEESLGKIERYIEEVKRNFIDINLSQIKIRYRNICGES